MTPEEFQKIKEAEKEHLRALKKLKQAVRGLEQRNKVTKAVTDIASSTGSLLDEHESLVEKLAHETALQEARLELAMENAEARAKEESDEVVDPIDQAAIDEELAKKRASDLVRQMKTQMSAPDKADRSSSAPSTPPAAEVEKTIGRPRAEEQPASAAATPAPAAAKSETDAQPESDVPEKTIGRMKPRK